MLVICQCNSVLAACLLLFIQNARLSGGSFSGKAEFDKWEAFIDEVHTNYSNVRALQSSFQTSEHWKVVCSAVPGWALLYQTCQMKTCNITGLKVSVPSHPRRLSGLPSPAPRYRFFILNSRIMLLIIIELPFVFHHCYLLHLWLLIIIGHHCTT